MIPNIWRLHLFSDGLVQPPTSRRWIEFGSFLTKSYLCNLMWITSNFPMRGTGRVMRFQTKSTLTQKLGLRWKWFGIQMVILKRHTEWYRYPVGNIRRLSHSQIREPLCLKVSKFHSVRHVSSVPTPSQFKLSKDLHGSYGYKLMFEKMIIGKMVVPLGTLAV